MSKRNPLALALVLVGTVIVLLACGESSNAAVATSGGNTSSNPTATHFKIKQVVKLGNVLTLTVNSFTVDPGDQFTTPKAGNKFVKVDISIKNISSTKQDISSIINFTLQDATGQKYDETIVTDATAPDGTVPAGGLLRGQLVYEVPKAQHAFTFTFDLDLSGNSTVIWDLSN